MEVNSWSAIILARVIFVGVAPEDVMQCEVAFEWSNSFECTTFVNDAQKWAC